MTIITVYYVEVREGMEIHRIVMLPDTLEAMQSLVGGHLEHITPDGLPQGIDMWINEEGRLIGLIERPTPFWPTPIHGSYFFARHDGQGNTTSLTQKDLIQIATEVGHQGFAPRLLS